MKNRVRKTFHFLLELSATEKDCIKSLKRGKNRTVQITAWQRA